MPVTKIAVKGYRGFSDEQAVRFAQPNGETGSGLTALVGPNNGGKSTVLESLHAYASGRSASFSEGKRNKLAGDRVSIRIVINADEFELQTVDTGGSETLLAPDIDPPQNWSVLPSRRFFRPYFGSGTTSRRDYLSRRSLPSTRSESIDRFSGRLFNALQNRCKFNNVLERVVAPVPIWTIDQSDEGNYYLKMESHGQYHNSDGLGEGIISLLFIVDALYDSNPDDLIVIDEPELSLHPTYQRRLLTLFADYAKDRQIVYATHSPYFVDFIHVLNGAEVARIHKREGSSVVSQLKRQTAQQLKGILRDSHNPHLLGLDAREVFFQEDGVVVVEGQEDVIYYPRVIDALAESRMLSGDLASYLRERFFGWGAGGATKIEKIAALLHDLGFERVAGVFDKNKSDLIPHLETRFPGYSFYSIPADDVRTKEKAEGRNSTFGLLDEDGVLRAEFLDETGVLFSNLAKELRGNAGDSKGRLENHAASHGDRENDTSAT